MWNWWQNFQCFGLEQAFAVVTNGGHILLDSVHCLESLLPSAGWIQRGGPAAQDALGVMENWENLS